MESFKSNTVLGKWPYYPLRGHNPISGWERIADSTCQLGNVKRPPIRAMFPGRHNLDGAGIAAALIDSLLWF